MTNIEYRTVISNIGVCSDPQTGYRPVQSNIVPYINLEFRHFYSLRYPDGTRIRRNTLDSKASLAYIKEATANREQYSILMLL
jgi:hypothetical protein